MGIDINVAKNAASGHWQTIASRVIGIPDDYLSGQNGPCPKCRAGTDRWKVYKDFSETGGAMCNQCGKSADGFALAQWFLDIPLNDAIEKVCSFLGVVDESKSKKSKRKRSEPAAIESKESTAPTNTDPENDNRSELEFIDWKQRLFDVWSASKKPITSDGVKSSGGRFAKYRGLTVIAIPIIGRSGAPAGYAVYNATGGTIPHKANKDAPLEQLKIKLVGATKESGWLGRILPGVETIKTEGVSDMLAVLSADPENASVVCNPFGANENPLGKFNQWMFESLRGERVYTVHDCDKPGVDGATWVRSADRSRPGWSTAIAIVAAESRNVRLPFEITENHGKDLRDYFAERMIAGRTIPESLADFMELARGSELVEKPAGVEISTDETSSADDDDESDDRHHVDDPHRLMLLNLANY